MKNYLIRSFDFRFDKAIFRKPSVLLLVISNLMLVAGVIFWRWEVFAILGLYWAENVVIGFYTILKFLTVTRDDTSWSAKIGAATFFCIHYGLFTLVHGIFVFVAFGIDFISDASYPGIWEKIIDYHLLWGVLILFISHGISFYFNYISEGEYKISDLRDLMQQPYGRVVALHVSIIVGGGLIVLLGSPVIGVVFLILIKTIMDIRAHLLEHEKYTSKTVMHIS